MTTIIALGLTWQFTIIIIPAITYDRCVRWYFSRLLLCNVDDTCTNYYCCNTDGCIKRRWYNVTLERESNHRRIGCEYLLSCLCPLQYISYTNHFSNHAQYRHLTIDIPTLYQYYIMDNLLVVVLSLQRTQFSQPHIVSRVKIILMISLYLSVVTMSMMVI